MKGLSKTIKFVRVVGVAPVDTEIGQIPHWPQWRCTVNRQYVKAL
jgi:hypothetical protein